MTMRNSELYMSASKDFRNDCVDYKKGYKAFTKMFSFMTMSPVSSYYIDYSTDSQILYFHIKYKNGASLNLSRPLVVADEDFLAYSFVHKTEDAPAVKEVGMDETINVTRHIFSLLN
jgi:hypothetical protein